MDIGEFDRAAVLWDIWDSADSWEEYETRRIALQETQAAMFPPESRPGSLVYLTPHCPQSANRQSLAQLYLQFFQFCSLHISQYVSASPVRPQFSIETSERSGNLLFTPQRELVYIF